MPPTKVAENGKKVWEKGVFVTVNPDIIDASINEDYLIISISSGTYEFNQDDI